MLEQSAQTRIAKDYGHSVLRIGFLPGGSQFFQCENRARAIVDATSGKRIREHPLKNEPTDVDIHPDGKRFVVAYARNQEIEERDLQTDTVLRTYPGYLHGTSQVRYSPDGSRLATAGAYAYEVRLHPVPSPGSR